MIEFRGPAKRIDDLDLPRVGAMIGVGEDEIHAVLDVEAAGSGFDSKARPKMLFEPHIFYRNLTGSKRERAVAEGLAYQVWRRDYPKDSYPRLLAAMAIDETAALKSASWGLGQILGENCIASGFKTAQDMVASFIQSEANQLEGMIRFIKTNKLDGHLRTHDWASFARGYNGPGFRKNDYDGRLERAYVKWKAIPDTPFNPLPPGKPEPPPPDIAAPKRTPVQPPPAEPGFWGKFADLFTKKA